MSPAPSDQEPQQTTLDEWDSGNPDRDHTDFPLTIYGAMKIYVIAVLIIWFLVPFYSEFTVTLVTYLCLPVTLGMAIFTLNSLAEEKEE